MEEFVTVPHGAIMIEAAGFFVCDVAICILFAYTAIHASHRFNAGPDEYTMDIPTRPFAWVVFVIAGSFSAFMFAEAIQCIAAFIYPEYWGQRLL